MQKQRLLLFLILLLTPLIQLAQNHQFNQVERRTVTSTDLKTGAERMELYLPLLKNKKVALVVNQSSLVRKTLLPDTVIKLKVEIAKIFTPEHGLSGAGEAGEFVANSLYKKTNIPVVSLYGKKLKPSKEDLAGVDVVVFDIQDVGARFYTYSSTMQYMMEACAGLKIPFILLDRPNPNGYYVDGPVLQAHYSSFIGLNPVPIVHGMTLGEYAQMINGEQWLGKDLHCDLTVIPVFNYNHNYMYQLPVPPSPNLPNMAAVYLYPTLCLFEGTVVSVGRGTSRPFQLIGYPGLTGGATTFMPVSMKGFSLNPPYKDKECQGFELREFSESYIKDAGRLYLYWILELYKGYPEKKKFFTETFNLLAGNKLLQKQIKAGLSEEEIRNSWKPDLITFKKLRKKYLLYPDFE